MDSQAGLDSIVDASYIGMPYIQLDEAERLKRTALNANQTLEQAIRDTLDERLERESRNEPRAATIDSVPPTTLRPFSRTPSASSLKTWARMSTS